MPPAPRCCPADKADDACLWTCAWGIRHLHHLRDAVRKCRASGSGFRNEQSSARVQTAAAMIVKDSQPVAEFCGWSRSRRKSRRSHPQASWSFIASLLWLSLVFLTKNSERSILGRSSRRSWEGRRHYYHHSACPGRSNFGFRPCMLCLTGPDGSDGGQV